jgi:hypothetical protein
MMRPWRTWALALVLLLTLASRAALADGTLVTGRLVDAATGQPIEAAVVTTTEGRAFTDETGRFTVSLPAGAHDLWFQADGYSDMTYRGLEVGQQPLQLDLEMQPDAPSPEQEEILRAKRLGSQLQLPEVDPDDLARGFQLAGVNQLPATIRVLMPDDSVVVMDMDEYLKGVVPQEVGSGWPAAALRAQAIAARSYAATSSAHADQGADVCTTVHCQVWKPIHYPSTDLAVDATHGVAATYGGDIIRAFFFGHCDGHTRNSEDIWWGYLPYCRAQACPCGFTTMWGHGVGMCQEGARVWALLGADHESILKHYYTGIVLTTFPTGRLTRASVFPLSGDEQTLFTYEATYHSTQAELPAAAQVLVDGRARPLVRVGPAVEGESTYRLVTKLAAGPHTYRFYFDDGYGHLSTVPVVGTFGGPLVEEGVVPLPTPPPIPTPGPPATSSWHVSSATADWEAGQRTNLRTVAVGDGALGLQDGAASGQFLSPPIAVGQPFQALGVVAYGDVDWSRQWAVAVRSSEDGALWGEWQTLTTGEDDPAGHRQWHSRLLPLSGRMVQYRLDLVRATGASPLVEGVRLMAVDASMGAQASQLATGFAQPSAGRPQIVPRSAWWGSDMPAAQEPKFREPRAIILHHLGELAGADAASFVRAVVAYQTQALGMSDIGYNYLVDELGNIYEGRSGGPGVVGQHAGRYDYGSIGIGLVGDIGPEGSSPMRTSLVRLLAWLCRDHLIDPLGRGMLLDAELSLLMAHRDCAAVACPGDALVAQLPGLRQATLDYMATIPPLVQFSSPVVGEAVRGVVAVGLDASAAITRVVYYVDGQQRAASDGSERVWRWNTLGDAEAGHTLRVVVANAAGSAEASAAVTVDNTPPAGTASAPPWSRSTSIAVQLSTDTDAHAVQLTSWVWEGESLPHSPAGGTAVADALALNGMALLGRAGVDQPGAWYGPYYCALTSWRSYDVYFRLRSPSAGTAAGLATLDIADQGGRRVYATRPLSGLDLPSAVNYEEVRLPLVYEGAWPTCQTGDAQDGLEFRTWFSGAGDLYLDRVAVYTAAATPAATYSWQLADRQGQQDLWVRFLDQAGNAREVRLAVGLDTQAPVWQQSQPGMVSVLDATSGINPATLRYATLASGSSTWSAWLPLGLDVSPGHTQAVSIPLPAMAGGQVRLRVEDMAGNVGESAALSAEPTLTPVSSPTSTATPTSTARPSATPSPTATVAGTPSPTITAGPSLPLLPRVSLPLILR